MTSLQLLMVCLCAMVAWAHGSDDRSLDKFYLLRSVLQRLANDVPGTAYDKALEEVESGGYMDGTSRVPDALPEELLERGWGNEMLKRAPPSGFSAARGKRQLEGKRVPSNKEFFGVRGKKDESPDKRHPSVKEFYGVRGKKSDAMKRFSWVRWQGREQPKEGVKRIPQSNMFYGARGKKSSYDQSKRVPANGFYGVRGKKSMDSEKRLNPNHFFGVRGKKSDDDIDKRFSQNDFFGVRGKKSDDDMDKRFSKNDFFGVRGKKSDAYLADNEDGYDKRLSSSDFYGVRGKKSSDFGPEDSQLKDDLLQLSNQLGQESVIHRAPGLDREDGDDEDDDEEY